MKIARIFIRDFNRPWRFIESYDLCQCHAKTGCKGSNKGEKDICFFHVTWDCEFVSSGNIHSLLNTD